MSALSIIWLVLQVYVNKIRVLIIFKCQKTQINICKDCFKNISARDGGLKSYSDVRQWKIPLLKKILDICVAARGSVAKRNCQHCREPERVG